jgi:phosphopantothenoylcysteine decarboxylase/phosphopantothenate--cysteine ligase
VDILATLGARRGPGVRPVLVGFAAQTGDPVPGARRKLESKGVDLIVANDVAASGSGFDVDTNEVTLVSRDATEHLPLMPKVRVAGALLDRIELLLHAPDSSPAVP